MSKGPGRKRRSKLFSGRPGVGLVDEHVPRVMMPDPPPRPAEPEPEEEEGPSPPSADEEREEVGSEGPLRVFIGVPGAAGVRPPLPHGVGPVWDVSARAASVDRASGESGGSLEPVAPPPEAGSTQQVGPAPPIEVGPVRADVTRPQFEPEVSTFDDLDESAFDIGVPATVNRSRDATGTGPAVEPRPASGEGEERSVGRVLLWAAIAICGALAVSWVVFAGLGARTSTQSAPPSPMVSGRQEP